MKIELIPVIEIGYNNQDVPIPDKYPYWDYPDVWDQYHAESYQKAGFKDRLTPYLPGSSFYQLADITDKNLTKLTLDHTEDMRNGKYGQEQASAFFGGYVLRVDEKDVYFPQCCGDLSDIQYWEKLVVDKQPFFYQGHPEPRVEIREDKIIFDFTVGEFDEHFSPTPLSSRVEIDKESLKRAISKAKDELEVFAGRIQRINIEENLNIDAIENLLIWGDNETR